MSRAKAKTTRRATHGTTQTYALGDDQLDPMLAALPSMIANAPLAWQRARRTWILGEIAALHPADALQAGLAGQIVVLRHLAVRTLGWADLRTTSPAQARRLGRTAGALAGAGERLERALRRWQRSAVPPGGARAADGFDLLAGEVGWRNDAMQREAGDGGGAAPSPVALRAPTSPALRERCTKARVAGVVA
jgi:hypothetical protein